ncbi:MAG: aldehyde dehydrogenase family protein [Pseudomonadota bacterium]
MASTKIAPIFGNMEYGSAPESDAVAREWLERHKFSFGHFINGRWSTPRKSKWVEIKAPATGEGLGKMPLGTKSDVTDAVNSSRNAQKSWAARDGFERAKYLYALANLIRKNSSLLAVLESLNTGKPVREARDDMSLAARHFHHHAGWAQLLDREFPGYAAHGVCGQIIPWNFPFLMLAWKIAPALAAGNTVILKPSEFTPLTSFLFAELCQEAGLPPGVVSIVQGDGSIGAEITKHPGIDKIAFTGSTETGRLVRKATAGSGKGLTLELGGKSPMIVFEDADLDSAVEGVVDGAWLNQGEVCCALTRLILQEGIADKMVQKLTRRMENMRVGQPLDKTVDMGAIISKEQFDRIDDLVKTGVREGATLIQTGKAVCPFYPPTLLLNVQPASTIAQTEIFGPVVSSMTFRTPEEAVMLANNSRTGLAASVWSENITAALDIAPKLKAGTVWINSVSMFDAACGFGGLRESGFGREGGREGMYSCLKPKHVKFLPLYKKSRTKPGTAEHTPAAVGGLANLDRAAKLYIGGKHVPPGGTGIFSIADAKGRLLGQASEGSREDIHNAVEAARKAEGWGSSARNLRAHILYALAENLNSHKEAFRQRLVRTTGMPSSGSRREVEESIRRLFTYAAWADKYDGDVHCPPARFVSLAMKEPVGVMGIVCPDESPLLGFVSLFAPAMAMGNRSVVIPSEKHPLSVTDFYQVLDTSDVPAGVVNIVTGNRALLTQTLAEHDDVDGVWYFGSDITGSAVVEKASIGNLKRTWVNDGRRHDWLDRAVGEGEEFLRHAVEIKNVWIPYGEQVKT